MSHAVAMLEEVKEREREKQQDHQEKEHLRAVVTTLKEERDAERLQRAYEKELQMQERAQDKARETRITTELETKLRQATLSVGEIVRRQELARDSVERDRRTERLAFDVQEEALIEKSRALTRQILAVLLKVPTESTCIGVNAGGVGESDIEKGDSGIDKIYKQSTWNGRATLHDGLRHARVGGSAVKVDIGGRRLILFAGGTDGVHVRADCEVSTGFIKIFIFVCT